MAGDSPVVMGTTRVCPETRIAQGHHGDKNSWWIAGTKCYHQSAGLLKCLCANHNVTFSEKGVEALRVWFE